MREGVGLHGEMDGGKRRKSVIGLDLSFNGSLKGMGQFSPKIVVLGGIPVLLKRGFEALFVENISPVTSGAYRTQLKIEERPFFAIPPPVMDGSWTHSSSSSSSLSRLYESNMASIGGSNIQYRRHHRISPMEKNFQTITSKWFEITLLAHWMFLEMVRGD